LRLLSYEEFLNNYPDLWSDLDRPTAYEVFCQDERERMLRQAHEQQEEDAERQRIFEEAVEAEEELEQLAHPEVYGSPHVRPAKNDGACELGDEEAGEDDDE